MIDKPGFDFSFSGLKTAVALVVKELKDADEQSRADVARAFVESSGGYPWRSNVSGP